MTNAGTVPLNEVFTLAHTEFVTTDYLTDFGHSPTLLNFILFELLTETSRQGASSFFMFFFENGIASICFFFFWGIFGTLYRRAFLSNEPRGSLISTLLLNLRFTTFYPNILSRQLHNGQFTDTFMSSGATTSIGSGLVTFQQRRVKILKYTPHSDSWIEVRLFTPY